MNVRAILLFIFLAIIVTTQQGCDPFMYGYTSGKAIGKYSSVSEQNKSFGYKRLRYNIGYHPHSELATFLEQQGYPDFIYEDEVKDSGAKLSRTRLCYIKLDSAYTFMDKKKCSCSPIKIEQRRMNEEEKSVLTIAK